MVEKSEDLPIFVGVTRKSGTSVILTIPSEVCLYEGLNKEGGDIVKIMLKKIEKKEEYRWNFIMKKVNLMI